MDISKPILYRNLDINGAVQTQRVLNGIAVESVDYSAVEGYGYMEKRAASDGMYASDVYLGPRQVEIGGHIYASNIAELFDLLHIVRAVFSPTSAYEEDPVAKGFLPLYFQQPTLDTSSFPTGIQNLMLNVRPLRQPQFQITRDRLIAANGVKPSAIEWRASLLAKDPRVYVSEMQIKDLAGPPVTVIQEPPLQAINRGDYASPLNIMLVVGTVSAEHTFRLYGFGVDMTIKIENKSNVIYRYRGIDRTLMTQDANDASAPEALRMDLVVWNTKDRFPAVPAQINPAQRPFYSTYTYTCSCALESGSRLFWNEAFA